jgi:hypothetical protein
MCDLSMKMTRESRARPLASRNPFRERCQEAPNGCAVLFVAHQYAPNYTQLKASSKGVAPLDAVPIQVQLRAQPDISQLHSDLFYAATGIVFSGTNRDVARP